MCIESVKIFLLFMGCLVHPGGKYFNFGSKMSWRKRITTIFLMLICYQTYNLNSNKRRFTISKNALWYFMSFFSSGSSLLWYKNQLLLIQNWRKFCQSTYFRIELKFCILNKHTYIIYFIYLYGSIHPYAYLST